MFLLSNVTIFHGTKFKHMSIIETTEFLNEDNLTGYVMITAVTHRLVSAPQETEQTEESERERERAREGERERGRGRERERERGRGRERESESERFTSRYNSLC